MKPPLVRMRLGELYGNLTSTPDSVSNTDQLGFIKSLTYTVPDSATWEFRKGQRVPKLIECSINFQMIHDSPPSILTQFYGYTGKQAELDIMSLPEAQSGGTA